MLTHEPTAAMLREWKECWKLHSPRLHPNRKTGAELLQYVRERYSLTEMTGPEAAAMLEALRLNVLEILLWLKSFRRELFHSREPFVWKTQEKESVYIKSRSPFFGEYILSFWESI